MGGKSRSTRRSTTSVRNSRVAYADVITNNGVVSLHRQQDYVDDYHRSGVRVDGDEDGKKWKRDVYAYTSGIEWGPEAYVPRRGRGQWWHTLLRPRAANCDSPGPMGSSRSPYPACSYTLSSKAACSPSPGMRCPGAAIAIFSKTDSRVNQLFRPLKPVTLEPVAVRFIPFCS